MTNQDPSIFGFARIVFPRRQVQLKTSRSRRLRTEQLENRTLMAADLVSEYAVNQWSSIPPSTTNISHMLSSADSIESFDDNYFPDDRLPSDENDESNWIMRMGPEDIADLIALATPAVLGEFTPQTLTFTTLANGMPILNSLLGSPTSVFLDFDGDTATGTNPYDVDGNSATFNAAEQSAIAEAWRHLSTYFAMFDTNVTTIAPAVSHPKAWAAIGNNIVGGYSFVNVFPNTTARSFNQSSDARNRASGIAHEVGHNFGLSHQSDFDAYGVETADYSSGYDELHVPIMGVDFANRVRKWVIGHTANASALQDDVSIIANKIKPYQAVGGDGFRTDDFGGTIATATPLISLNDVQYETGIIERLSDVDAFSFISNGQSITVSAAADFPSGVDLKLEIYDALGVLVAAKDADFQNDQSISLVLPSGTYYALVSSHGNYGDIGTYNIAVRSLPVGWSAMDVGVVGITGFSQYHSSTNSFVLGGSGADIAGTADEMQFAMQTLTGNGSIIARVESLSGTDANAKAGIEIRESTSNNSKHVSLTATRSSGVRMISRSTTGGSSSTVSSAAGAFAPVWVRLTRAGNVFTAATSSNGSTWTNLGTVTVAMNATVQVGMVATARNDRLFNVAEFTNVALTGTIGTTQPIPNALTAPSNVAVSRGTGSDLIVTWNDQVNSTGYRVERSIDGVVFTTAGTTSAGVTSFQDTGLVGTMRYFYQVRALNASGASVPSTIVTELNRPSAVKNLELTSYSTTQVVLDWIDTSGETGYRIERSTDGINFTTIGTVAANIPSYTNSGLVSGSSYQYRVIPTSSLGDGVVAALAGVTRLQQVTGLVFDSVTSTQTQLRWTDIPTESGYRIERSTDGKTFSQIATLASNTTTYTDATVLPATEYYYRVLGTLGQSVSTYNLIFAATPPASPLPSPWSSVDIGTVSGRGSSSLTNGTFKIISSGQTIGGSSDSFQFTHQPLNGNGSVVARIASIEDTAGSARLGVMIRESLNSNARFVSMTFRPPTTTSQMQWRSNVGTNASAIDGATLSAPNWVRISRVGNVFTSATSNDGFTWTNVGQVTIAMSATTFVGLAATANSTSVLNTATATNVSVLADPVVTITSTNQVYTSETYIATASITGNNSPLPTLSYVFYSDAAGTNIIPTPVSVGSYYVRAFSAANSGNNAAQSAIHSFIISPLTLAITAVGQDRVYNGNTGAIVVFSDNRLLGDVLTVSATAAFDSKNVGNSKSIAVSNIILSGADANNYTFNTTATATGNITPLPINAQITAPDKTYDSNTSSVVHLTLSGIVGNDLVNVTAVGSFSDKIVGSNKSVTIQNVAVTGADSGNYSILVPTETTASISAKAITGSITVANKVFDGTTAATILTRSLVGVLLGDVVTYVGGTSTFENASVGNNKLVSATNLSLTGVDAGNYTVNTIATTTASITQPIASIASRNIFYNNATGASLSSLGAAANAIASDKVALFPGQTSTFANYTNYSRGLNGILVDINNLPASTTNSQILASMQFERWNGIDAIGFSSLPPAAIPSAVVLAGSGVGGSTRVKITFPDNSLQNTWLRITILANATTTLASNEVFYFGNVIGDFGVGNSGARLRVNATDTEAIRSNQSTLANSAGVYNIYDVNRDGRVNATDTSIVRSSQQTLGVVAHITPPLLLSSFQVSMNAFAVPFLPLNAEQESNSISRLTDATIALTVDSSVLNTQLRSSTSPVQNTATGNSLPTNSVSGGTAQPSATSVDAYFASLSYASFIVRGPSSLN